MQQYKLKSLCLKCGGDGIYPHQYEEPDGTIIWVEEPCESCEGVGVFHYGNMDGANDADWIKRKIKKILQHLNIEDDEE